MLIKETIKDLRKSKGFTQEEMAKKLSCNRQKIADWERGKSTPSADDLILLSKLFKVSTDYLLGLSDVPTTDKDLQFVCDYTGLDEYSIEELHKLQNLRVYEVKREENTPLSSIRKRNLQRAEIDLTFLNDFLASPFNSVFNHRDSQLYEYYEDLEKCIDLYNQIMEFEIKEDVENISLLRSFAILSDEASAIRKKIKVDTHIIIDDFKEALESFAHTKLQEIKDKEERVRKKLNLIYTTYLKNEDGDNNANNPQT